MKSKKAKIYLNRSFDGRIIKIKQYTYNVAVEAIGIAEEEMKEKAIEAHFKTCPHLYDRNCTISESGMCEYKSGGKCKYMNDFIEELDIAKN